MRTLEVSRVGSVGGVKTGRLGGAAQVSDGEAVGWSEMTVIANEFGQVKETSRWTERK